MIRTIKIFVIIDNQNNTFHTCINMFGQLVTPGIMICAFIIDIKVAHFTALFTRFICGIISRHIHQCLELFPACISVSGMISRHICQCLELFSFQTYMAVSGNISRHISQCLELFPDIYLSVRYYFQTYVAAVSGTISRQIC